MITVIGHKNQDPDSVCGAITMANLLQTQGFDAKAFIQEKPVQGCKFILDYFGVSYPEVKTSIGKDEKLFLVDHNDALQSLEGMPSASIVGVVDHHEKTISLPFESFQVFRKTGSCNTIIYSLYRDKCVEPSPVIAGIMLAGIIADTRNFTKGTTTPEDIAAAGELEILSGIESVSRLAEGILSAQKSFEGMSDLEIFNSDLKIYDIAGKRIAIASLHTDGDIEEFNDKMSAIMPNINADIVLCKIEDGNLCYISFYGDGADALVEKCFGAVASGNHIILKHNVSRKTCMIPLITSIL